MATFNPHLGVQGNTLFVNGFHVVETCDQSWAEMDQFAQEHGEGEFNRSGGAVYGAGHNSRVFIFTDEKTAILFKLGFGGVVEAVTR